MSEFGVDVLITKDSGGAHTVAKLDAAGDLGIPVVVIARPRREPVAQVGTVAGALAWLSDVPAGAPGMIIRSRRCRSSAYGFGT